MKLGHQFTHKELHYSELSRLKVDCAKAVVDWYFGASDAEFRCTVVPGGIFDHTRYRGNMQFMSSEEMSYNVIYKAAINYHVAVEEKTMSKVLLLDRKDKARQTNSSDIYPPLSRTWWICRRSLRRTTIFCRSSTFFQAA